MQFEEDVSVEASLTGWNSVVGVELEICWVLELLGIDRYGVRYLFCLAGERWLLGRRSVWADKERDESYLDGLYRVNPHEFTDNLSITANITKLFSSEITITVV